MGYCFFLLCFLVCLFARIGQLWDYFISPDLLLKNVFLIRMYSLACYFYYEAELKWSKSVRRICISWNGSWSDLNKEFWILFMHYKSDLMECMQAFEAAWAAACKVEASTMVVPAEFQFLVSPISFSGPYCQPNIVFQVAKCCYKSFENWVGSWSNIWTQVWIIVHISD